MPEAVNCPRCGSGFACGAQDRRCDCFEIRLSAAQQEAIAARWPQACLCLACLRELATQPVAPRAFSDSK